MRMQRIRKRYQVLVLGRAERDSPQLADLLKLEQHIDNASVRLYLGHDSEDNVWLFSQIILCRGGREGAAANTDQNASFPEALRLPTGI